MLFESQSRPKQQLLFEPPETLPGRSLPATSREVDGQVAGRIIEDRERLIRSNGSVEPKFQLNAGKPTSGRASRPFASEVPDRLTTTVKASYEARVKAARAKLGSQPLLALFDAPPRPESPPDMVQLAADLTFPTPVAAPAPPIAPCIPSVPRPPPERTIAQKPATPALSPAR